MSPFLSSNFEMQNYYQNKTKVNGVYPRTNIPKIKDGTYIINFDEYKSTGTHMVALYVNGNNVTQFDSFGGEHIAKEIKKVISNKNIKTNIYRIQANGLIMCGYFCIEFIGFILKGKSWLDYNNLFSPKECEKNIKQYQNIFNE